MKKKKILFTLFFIIVSVVILLFAITGKFFSPNYFQKKEVINIDNTLTYVGELTGDELFVDISPEYMKAPIGYKQLKIECSFKNNTKTDIDTLCVESSDNEKILTYNGCLDYCPSFPVEAGETIDCDLYFFVDEKMNEEEVKEELSKTTFRFSCRDGKSIKKHGISKKYFTGTVSF